ncbi:unnamed protein product [Echinostoma caproni]|uniref:Uncharacterized protein n=1 Tax=Echinostoma caproni TaxID=27848 RepID=A0A3P8HTL3_9TREM|nr:unnamed protein product [Echinostoma caproni]
MTIPPRESQLKAPPSKFNHSHSPPPPPPPHRSPNTQHAAPIKPMNSTTPDTVANTSVVPRHRPRATAPNPTVDNPRLERSTGLETKAIGPHISILLKPPPPPPPTAPPPTSQSSVSDHNPDPGIVDYRAHDSLDPNGSSPPEERSRRVSNLFIFCFLLLIHSLRGVFCFEIRLFLYLYIIRQSFRGINSFSSFKF